MFLTTAGNVNQQVEIRAITEATVINRLVRVAERVAGNLYVETNARIKG
jgi:hypothetical protein